MKYFILLPLFSFHTLFGQLTLKRAQDSLQKFHISSYSYMDDFKGHKGYGASVILTKDGGAAAFGHGDNGAGIYKLDTAGRKKWEKFFTPQFTELELQSIVQDIYGNYYVCMLSYDEKRYRGGTERVICLDKNGKILWDKTLGNYTVMNSPTIQYMHQLPDGRIELRGHVVIDKQEKDKDPVYRFWQGWINAKGVYTQKTGEVINWSDQKWKNFYKAQD
jgi:hypothetical protein